LLITGAGNTITYTPTLTGTLSNAGLANSTIAFANGTTGSDVNWSTSPVSLGGTATLNIPSASASARGLLSSADWITFTNKISSTSLDTITELDSLITDVTGVTGTGSFVLSASPTFTGTTTAANFSLSGVFRDVTNNAGTNGMVLLSTGTSTLWVATSSLGIDGGTPGGSLFTDGGATTYLTSLGDTLGIGTTSSIAKMTVAGDINLDGNYGFSLNNIRYFSGTTDTNNIQIGRDAGLLFSSLNTSNVAIGHEAGRYASTTNADYNVMIGYQAGLHNTAAGNVLLGYGAGDYNSDYGNIMLGEFAGQNNSSDSNILIGNNTGRYNSSFSNIFIGESAGENNTNNSNYFIGVGAGKNNIGTVNTIIGYNAGVDNTGDENVSIGDNAGYANQGDHNNILGAQAGLDNRGDYNNLFGESAGYSNRGSFNNVVGYLAAYNNTGAYNDIIGYQAGANLQATNTVAIGANALSGGDVLTNGAGNFQALNNVAIGYRAGYSAETGADNNVFIGYQAGSNVTTGKNNIVLGYDLFLQSATQNNSLTIGNLLFATGLTATGTATSTGKFGLGTSTPSAQLTTVGTVRLAAFGSGALQSDALGNISVSSDERLKDIQGEFTKGLDVLMAIDPIQYKWKTSTGYDTANVYTGFSAQNVQMVLPEAVGKSNDGYLTLSDRPILAAVINAIKEIYAWMHTTDARVNTLEAQVQSMQSEIDALKSNNTPSQPQGDNNQSSNQPIPTDASVVTPTSTVPSTSDTAPATLPDATSDSEVVSTPETGESESGPQVPVPNMKFSLVTIIFAVLLLPTYAHAQLESENYIVEGAAFNGNNTSLGGTSTNYTADFEAGNLYILPDAAAPLISTTKYGTKIILPSIAASTFLTPTIFGPESAAVGSLVTLYVQVVRSDGVPLDPDTLEVLVTILGANANQPTVTYRGFGLYQVTYYVTNAGLDTVVATVNGMPVAHDVDGVDDGILQVVAESRATTPVIPPHTEPIPVSPALEVPAPVSPPVTAQPTHTPEGVAGEVSPPSSSEGFLDTLPLRLQQLATWYPLLVLTSAVGALTGIMMIALAFSRIPFSYTEIGNIISYGTRHIFGLVTWQKRRRPWGVVYDSVTKVPLDPAYVQLFTAAGAMQVESITDLDGRYGFLVPEGTYTLTVNKTNYQFPSSYRPLLGQDVLYSNLYFGGEFAVSDTVVRDIPLDPTGYDWNQAEKVRTKQIHFFRSFDLWIISLSDLLFHVGFLALCLQFILAQTIITGLLLVGYVVLLYLRLSGGKPILYGVLAKQHTPLAFAIVRVLKSGYEVAYKVADSYGRYAVLVAPGTYTVRIEERLGLDSYQTVYEHDVSVPSGIINMHLKI
jgi:hypothetical protein